MTAGDAGSMLREMGMMGLLQNMNELKTTKKALREVEEKYRILFESSRDAITMYDENGFFDCNQAALHLFGFAGKEELIGRTPGDLSPVLQPDGGSSLLGAKHYMDKALREGSCFFEWLSARRDGTEFYSNVLLSKMVLDEKPVLQAVIRDITGRKKGEAALRESEERLQLVLRSGEIGYWDWNIETDVVVFNRRWLEMLGYRSGEVPNHLNSWKGSIHPEDQEKTVEALYAHVAGKTAFYETQHRLRTKAGEWKWFIGHGKVVEWDPEGRPLRATGTNIDITALKQASEAQRESEARYRAIFNSAADAFLLIDRDGRIFKANPHACRIYGYSRDEIQQLILKDIVHPDFHHLPEQAENDIKTKGELLVESLAVRKDGTCFPVEVKVGEIDYRGEKYLLYIARDITERRKAEEKLAAAHQELLDIIEFLPDATFVIDQEHRVIAWNKAMEEMTGLSKADMIGKGDYAYAVPFYGTNKPILIDHVSRRRPRIEQEYEFCESRNGILSGEKFSCKMNHGKGAHLYGVAAPLFDQKGNLTGAIESIRDITERKRMEEELVKIQKLESIGVLAGGIAHEFNNLLMAIMGNITLARLYSHPESGACEPLDRAEQVSLRAQGLTQQLITFAKGGGPIKRIVSISDLIRDSALFALGGSGSRCELSVARDLWPVNVDEDQIRQVIHNIVVNADQAMPNGGTIRVFAENVKKSSGWDPRLEPGPYVRITIMDHGKGISSDHLSQIFDPFFSTKEKNSGLGLTTAHSIIQKHGGRIRVESENGVGSTVIFYLPAALPKLLTDGVDTWDDFTEAPKRILLMDDEEILLDAVGSMLKFLGYEVDLARDGGDAIALFRRAKKAGTPYDLLILDLTIAGAMGGKQAIQELRRIEPDIKAIVSSGYSSDPVMENYEAYGFSGVLAKPFNLDSLRSVVENVLN